MNNQEIFDKVAEHLMRQGKKSYHGLICMYRSKDGLKCAVGCLIPDNLYKPEFEGFDISTSSVSTVFDQIGIEKVSIPLVAALQRLHDRHLVSEWKDSLVTLANSYDLKVPTWLK